MVPKLTRENWQCPFGHSSGWYHHADDSSSHGGEEMDLGRDEDLETEPDINYIPPYSTMYKPEAEVPAWWNREPIVDCIPSQDEHRTLAMEKHLT